jgi:hypothetical protein
MRTDRIFAYCEDGRQEEFFADCEEVVGPSPTWTAEARLKQTAGPCLRQTNLVGEAPLSVSQRLRQRLKAKAKITARGLGTGLAKRNRRISGGSEKPEASFLAGGGGAGGEACVFGQFRDKRERAALERGQWIIHQESLRDFFAMRFL